MDKSSVKNVNSFHSNEKAGQTSRTEHSAGVAGTASAGNTSDTAAAAMMRCPACRAQQVWSPECRRCGADLMMMMMFEKTRGDQRCLALTALRDGRNQTAIRHASRLYHVRPDTDSVRLLAVCLLMAGNFAQACQIANMCEFSE